MSAELTILFDGLCPVCAREMGFLRNRDRARRIEFVDIAAAGFDPGRFGLSMPQVIGAMHAVLPDGRVIVGVEVFRRAYALVGLGWLLRWTAWPLLRPVADFGYRIFARVRPRFSKLPACGDRCGVVRPD